MIPFSPRRAIHQHATTSEVTGDIPTPALLAGCRRTDGGSAAHASQDSLGFRAMAFGWAGCLDAPELIATGSHVAAYSTEGFEGIVSRSYPREAA